jgi:hypothetical protein
MDEMSGLNEAKNPTREHADQRHDENSREGK